jgi:hypothetical protein
MTEDRGKERILGTETPASGLADTTHHEEPKIFGSGDREPVDDITYIGIEGEESPRGYSRAGTGFFPQVLSTLRDRYYPISILRQNTHGDCKVLLRITVNSKDPEPFLCKQVGEKSGNGGFTDPALSGNYDPDSRSARRGKMAFFC